MSRIHDALLKAEQERRSGTAAPVETPAEPLLANMPPLPPEMALPAPAVEMPLPPPPAPAVNVSTSVLESAAAAASPTPVRPPVTFDELQKRCKVREWKLDPAKLLDFNVPRPPVGAEELRTLRSRLYQLRGQMPLKRLLVASALPGEGKTFCSANLAQTFVRQRGRRVLLIDGDLRYPRLHQAFNTTREPGLSDFLKGECDEFTAIQKGPLENLFLMTGGRTVSNPAELIGGTAIKKLLDALESCFDWIIVDSPAALPLADASMLANFCDGVLMVVDSGSTPYHLAQKARNEFQHRPIVGVVLNRMSSKSMYSSYYYYGSYGEPGKETNADANKD